MKKINNKGFAISTLIYGVMILFMLVISLLIVTLLFRYKLFKDISSKITYYEYDEQINIHLYNNDTYESQYIVPYNATYYFYEVFENATDFSGEPIKIYLEKGEIIKLTDNKLQKLKENVKTIEEIIEINDGNKLILDKILSTEELNIPNPPNLSSELIPIKYDEDECKWVIVRETAQWYDYDKQIWANAVILKNQDKQIGDEVQVDIDKTNNKIEDELDVYAMFVWIPRYSYTIGCTSTDSCLGYKIDGASDLATATPGAIDIKFIKKNTKDLLDFDNNEYPNYIYDSNDLDNRTPNNWYTHPAFTFGDDDLSGIWVGKFETTGLEEKSDNEIEVKILPNIRPFTTVNEENIIKIKNSSDYRLMKNSEWAAVAYLSQSIYGKYGNTSYEAANKEIYKNDAGGGSYISNYTGRSYGKLSTSNFQHSPNGEYKYDGTNTSPDGTSCLLCGTGASTTGNIYGIYDMVGGAYEVVEVENLEVGQATKETKNWYNDEYDFSENYMLRGGYYFHYNSGGIFSSFGSFNFNSNNNVSNISFRITKS